MSLSTSTVLGPNPDGYFYCLCVKFGREFGTTNKQDIETKTFHTKQILKYFS